jgi:hypothetical protein
MGRPNDMEADMVSHAINFGESADGALGENKAFPYIFNFISDLDDPNTQLGGIGPTVPALSNVKLSINMGDNYNFLPRWMRYTVYYFNPITSLFEFWDTTPPAAPELFANRLSGMGDALTNFITIALVYQPDARYGMGQIPGVFSNEIPIPLSLLYDPVDSGQAGVKILYMLPPHGRMELTITNIHATKALTVGGCIYGWKARI